MKFYLTYFSYSHLFPHDRFTRPTANTLQRDFGSIKGLVAVRVTPKFEDWPGNVELETVAGITQEKVTRQLDFLIQPG